jgi:hypothetical protein
MARGDNEAQSAPKMRALGRQDPEAYGTKSSDKVSAFITKDPLHHQDQSQSLPGLLLSCMCGPIRCACFFLHLFCPTRFSDGILARHTSGGHEGISQGRCHR